MKLLITGANGFVSGALISRLFLGSQYQIKIALRRKVLDIPQGAFLQVLRSKGITH